MSKQTIKIMGKYLNSLKEDQMEEFKKMLCTMNAPKGTKKIQVNQLKNKSAKEISEIIVEAHTIQKGPPHVINVFKKINLNQKATDFQKELKEVATTKKTVETPDSSATTAGKKTATAKTTGATAAGKKTATAKTTGATAECNPPKTSKAKTATSPGEEMKDAKPTAVTNVGVGPSSKPTKKTTSKIQASDAIPGTSQNTGQTSTKKKATKRKLDQAEQDEMDTQDEQQTQQFKKAKVVKPQLTIRERLLKTLQQMTQNKFEEFKLCLKDEEFLLRNQYDPMTTSELENKNTTEVSELLIRRYTKERALLVTFLVLERIGEKQLANNLRPYLDID